MEGYCMKCKAKREIENEKTVKVRGRNAVTGTCKKCGTKIFKFV